MSRPENVLYDEPGPRARRRALVGTVVAGLLLLGVIGLAVRKLAQEGQFDMELWGPLIDPGNESFRDVWRLLGRGLQATLISAVLAIVLSLVVGTLLGTLRLRLGRWSRMPVVGVIELLRGLPVVITIFFVWQVLPETPINVGPLPGEDGLWYLVIGLTLYNSVIIAEIIRAGVLSLPRGQGEAARAVGMTEGQVMSTVLLPQAFRTMLPALISQLVVVLKDTSLAAVLGLYLETLRRANLIAQNLDNPIQVLTVVGLMFIVINYALSRLAVWTERRVSRSGFRPEAAEAEVTAGA
ncbi:amino acid ABC transporter permease [Nocardioides caldifontis]|uniref:amino acid ABC transporter permease n=1 Tax=Nocardioides caldifontis TaxID=2588938 RepID=UPI0011DF9415|nr:amino acid ABC transporter permease [Nocardioides caldifontis]